MTQRTAQIAFIGGGNMGGALIGGLLASGYPADHIRVSERNAGARARLQSLGELVFADCGEAAIAGADLVVLAVKPQVCGAAARPLAAILAGEQPVFMSIAAGIPTSTIANWIGKQVPVVRCVPNTPALLGCGISGLYATPRVDAAGCALATQVTNAVGSSLWVDDEALMDVITAVSGSGPAYFFRLMEAMTHAGQQLGLTQQQAHTLVTQTALGAAKMATQSELAPEDLRRQVTSPGGTTAAALAVFEQANLTATVQQAMTAATGRGRELGAEHT